MNKLKSAFASIAIVAAMTGAFAFKVPLVPKTLDLYWIDATTGTNDGFKSETQEAIDRGCTGGTNNCAFGYSDQACTIHVATLFKP